MIPLITVVIPVFNAEAFISDAINSVLNQTFENFELLLMDDGSTDNSRKIINSYNDNRMSYFACKHDFIETHRRGYEMARGKYIAQLDHDDIMMPERLRLQFEFMESNPQIAACGGYMQRFGKYQNRVFMPLEHEEIVLSMITYMPVCNSTGFFRKEFLLQHGIKHQRGYSYAADFKFWVDIARKGKLKNIPEILTKYRTYDAQTSLAHRPASKKASYIIQQEMIEHLLSGIETENAIGNAVHSRLLPSLRKLKERNYFSPDVYFSYMHELMTGLYQKRILNI